MNVVYLTQYHFFYYLFPLDIDHLAMLLFTGISDTKRSADHGCSLTVTIQSLDHACSLTTQYKVWTMNVEYLTQYKVLVSLTDTI